jgi:SOS-response transcriptional repressor LexA
MMKIDNVEVTFPLLGDRFEATEAQSDVYTLLLCLMSAGVTTYSAKAMSNQLGLRSPAPLWSRLKHLQEKGWLRLLETAIAV